MVTVCTEIDLGDVSTAELLRELSIRHTILGNGLQKDLSADLIIRLLEALDCPASLTRPLESWMRQPIVDSLTLKQWKQACGIA